MKALPDINIWLALTFSGHPHHVSALAWFDAALPDSCTFCRMTQQGFLRLVSNPKVFKQDALSLPKAWQAYDSLCGDERVNFTPEPVDLEPGWRSFTSDEHFSPKIWNDAYLAAFATSGRFQLVSFDRGFRRYDGLSLNLLQ